VATQLGTGALEFRVHLHAIGGAAHAVPLLGQVGLDEFAQGCHALLNRLPGAEIDAGFLAGQGSRERLGHLLAGQGPGAGATGVSLARPATGRRLGTAGALTALRAR